MFLTYYFPLPAPPRTHVALLDVGLELAAKVDWVGGIVGLEHIPKILHYHICVVVRLHEPIIIIAVGNEMK